MWFGEARLEYLSCRTLTIDLLPVWQAISNKTNTYILAVNTYVFLTKMVRISINWYVFNQHVRISKYVRIRFKLVPVCSESARI